jgi:NAD(P)-dependent dehydrogenase (short-subunit alcohol dehydrogenase family)
MNRQTKGEEVALIIGASGSIGAAVANRFLDTGYHVIGVSRQPAKMQHPNLTWYQTDHGEASMAEITESLSDSAASLQRVVICTGVLHGDDFAPEKKIEQLHVDAMRRVFDINVHVPAGWLRALTPLLCRSDAVVAVLSARVGSIEDNRSGGWYSYRSSKAALNMILKSLSIELARRAPGVKLLAFHPGTTDSALSQPFQKNVPAGKLFTPAFVAERLTAIMDAQRADGTLDFLDWQGLEVPW